MPRLQLPTRDEVRQLPRWSRVAYAVRCARLVQPLLAVHLPTAGPRLEKTLDDALRLAGDVAAEQPVWAPDRTVIRLHAALLALTKHAKRVRKESPIAAAVLTAAAQAAASAEEACCQARFKDATLAAAAATAALAADPAALKPIRQAWRELRVL
jgi:hypothetical protein